MGIFYRTNKPYGGSGNTAIIAPGTRIEGSIFSKGGVHIDGEVEGDVIAQSYVIVTTEGVVHGRIEANDVYVSGTVYGDIKAAILEFYEGAKCYGKTEATLKKKDEADGV